MFYCTECGRERGWPAWMVTVSYGPCEVCRQTRPCHDISAAELYDDVEPLDRRRGSRTDG